MELVSGDALFSPSIFYPAAGERLVRIFAGDRLPHCRTNHCPHDGQIPRTPPCSLANCIVDVCRTLFWVLAQQGGSTISLFIDRFVNRQAFNIEVPTALFQSVNAIAVMLAGVVLAWLASPESRGNSTLRVWLKFAFGLLLMACGFMLLAFDARHAAADGQASMGVMISGLALMALPNSLLTRWRLRKSRV